MRLKQKRIRKIRYVTYYDQLFRKNQDFLQENIEVQAYQSNSKQKQNLLRDELKKWMKEPDEFEKQFNVQISKNNLVSLYNLNLLIHDSINKILKMFELLGFRYQGCSFLSDILSFQSSKIYEFIENEFNRKISQFYESKLITLNIIENMIQIGSSIEQIDSLITELIPVYQTQLFTEKIKFKVSRQDLKYFNFDLRQKILVLRNPSLNEQPSYEIIQEESQFSLIDNGQYAYRNQYRLNIFCEEKFDIERDQNIMIGRQFHPKVKEKILSNKYEKYIEINQPLSSKYKIYVRLRLNTEDHGQIKFCFLNNVFQPNSMTITKNRISDIILHIIPDSGQRNRTYAFDKCREPHRYLLSEESDEYMFLVLEDDIISLSLNIQEHAILIRNQTQDYLINRIQIKKSKNFMFEKLRFQSQVFVGVTPSSTIPEIQILQFSKPQCI